MQKPPTVAPRWRSRTRARSAPRVLFARDHDLFSDAFDDRPPPGEVAAQPAAQVSAPTAARGQSLPPGPGARKVGLFGDSDALFDDAPLAEPEKKAQPAVDQPVAQSVLQSARR